MDSTNEIKAAPVDAVVVRRFADSIPSRWSWFVFVDPEDTARWIIGWHDWYHIRVEGGASYRLDDIRLTWWYPLPDVPSA